MSQLRSDIWCAAFIRRHNDIGHMCVVSRKGDPTAGQIWIEVDHLNGSVSLFSPAPAIAVKEDTAERVFECRFERVEPQLSKQRTDRELEFDPDIWIISLEMRSDDLGIEIINHS